MTEEKENKCGCGASKGRATSTGASGTVWFLGFVGAAIYYIQVATSFWNGAYGILKAFVWPAILVYKALELLSL